MRASVLISIVLGLSCAQDFSAFSVVSSTTDDTPTTATQEVSSTSDVMSTTSDDASTTPAPETSTPEINLSEEEGSTTPVQETLYGGEASSEEEGSINPAPEDSDSKASSSLFVFPIILGTVLFAITF